MRNSLKVVLLGAAVVMSVSLYAREGGRGGRGGNGGNDRETRTYVCRATAMEGTHEGAFYLGMGRSASDACWKAYQTCQRFSSRCSTSLEP
jgi:hypothetical protein